MGQNIPSGSSERTYPANTMNLDFQPPDCEIIHFYCSKQGTEVAVLCYSKQIQLSCKKADPTPKASMLLGSPGHIRRPCVCILVMALLRFQLTASITHQTQRKDTSRWFQPPAIVSHPWIYPHFWVFPNKKDHTHHEASGSFTLVTKFCLNSQPSESMCIIK